MNPPADFRCYLVHRIGADYDIICTRPFQCLCGFRQNICALIPFPARLIFLDFIKINTV